LPEVLGEEDIRCILSGIDNLKHKCILMTIYSGGLSATHMLENGTDLRYIQNLLGHNSSKTTEIYTHITTKGMEQLTSPFDRLGIGIEENKAKK
jgi:integrase